MNVLSFHMPSEDGIVYLLDNDHFIAAFTRDRDDKIDLYLWAMLAHHGYDMDGVRLKVIGVDIIDK